MKGRITEEQLPLAEICCPGITNMYRTMRRKPETFLDLLWMYEGARQEDNVAETTESATPTNRRAG